MPFCNAYPALGGLANVGGTLNVFEAARDAGRPVGIVYASSSTVYRATASDDGRSLTENDAANPDTLYGAFKRSNEITAHACYRSYGVSSIGLRPGVIYGVGRDSGISAGPSIAMKAIAFDRPYVVRFSGPVDLHFVEDVADAFVRSLLLPQEGAHISTSRAGQHACRICWAYWLGFGHGVPSCSAARDRSCRFPIASTTHVCDPSFRRLHIRRWRTGSRRR